MNKMNKINKKDRIEIIERMKKAINVETDVELAKYFDTMDKKQAGRAVNAYKIRGDASFYAKIVEFGIKHNVSVNWLVSGTGEMFIQTPQDTAFTPDERDLTSKLLAVLRHGPDEEMKTVFRNLVNTYYTAYTRAAGDSADKPKSKGGERTNVK